MLYILIPCLLLLVIAVVLKKRESDNSKTTSDSDKKSIAKKSKKNTSNRASRAASSAVKVDLVSPVVTAPAHIDPETLTHIQHLIKTENYDVAEAKINQLLNKNNRQDQLYLYLLEIHVAQNDDFAIKKLISHLRSLDLHEIADQAEIKQQATVASQPVVAADIIDQAFKAARSKASLPQDEPLKSATAFDSLINNPSNNNLSNSNNNNPSSNDLLINDLSISSPVSNSFDSPRASSSVVLAEASDLPPIEYSFTSSSSNTTESIEKNQQVDLESTKITAHSDTLSAASESPQKEALERQEKATTALEFAPLEFTFSAPVRLDEQTENTSITEQAIVSEELVFQEPVVNELKVAEYPCIEFKLNEDLATTTQAKDFNFNLDAPPPADLNLVTFATKNIDLTATETAARLDSDAIKHANDPLVQTFPELLEINEIQLNLDLASRYIELGAYTAAKKLLAAEAVNYSLEQRQHSEKLLNQIAS